jgi:hypothetical protein
MSPKEAPDPGTVARALIERFESAATVGGGIRVEDLLSAAAAVCGEACIAAAGEFDPENHDFTPGSVVMSDRINGILAGDSTDWEQAGESVFGVIRASALANGYAADEFPKLENVFRGFAAGVASGETEWGFVPLTVPADNLPRIQPVRSAYELRGPVHRILADNHVARSDAPALIALAIGGELARVREAIDHRIATTLVLETINGMAKTAPMTDTAFREATGPGKRG